MHLTITALWHFYRSYAPTAWLMTVVCSILLYNLGTGVLLLLFILKLFTLFMTVLYTNINKRKELFFYYNMGIGKWLLWLCSLTADMVLFMVSLFLTLRLL